MKVFKFGGASVKDADGIKNLFDIVSMERGQLALVISAFGKTTNALENVLKAWMASDNVWMGYLDAIYSYHKTVIDELLPGNISSSGKIDIQFAKLKEYLLSGRRTEYDMEYDQVVSYGEIWSTLIISEYINTRVKDAEWLDIREILITDNRHRDAAVLWEESLSRVRKAFDFSRKRIYVTQGFIGGTFTGYTTTLGREGSDYTAAILGNMLDAEKVVVWKDVPGILNADPKWLPDAEKLGEISYREAVEMTFSGAKVIHPKTIKPLHNKNIPLHVKSFIHPGEEGTIIVADAVLRKLLPVYIKKEEQILISILPKDFSFVMGESLGKVFHSFTLHGIKVNLVEASAVSINVCVDDERPKVDALLAALGAEYSAVYNENVEMLTIRHYTPSAINRITYGREILLEQKTRSTVRFVVRKA